MNLWCEFGHHWIADYVYPKNLIDVDSDNISSNIKGNPVDVDVDSGRVVSFSC